MAIGETGTLSENTTYTGEPISVSFTEPLTDPVVALTATNHGGNKFSLRVIEFQTDANGDATGFTFTLDEWENHDGAHPAVEDINWIAIESGTHVLPDGRLIEAGYADADSDGEDVTLAHDFPDTPVVLTTVASDTHAAHVDSDPTAITSGGLHAQPGRGRAPWTVSTAWKRSAGSRCNRAGMAARGRRRTPRASAAGGRPWASGASFETPSSWPKPRRRTRPTPATSSSATSARKRSMRFEEDTSADNETTHGPRPWRSLPSRPG
jgi:hypothetical protein